MKIYQIEVIEPKAQKLIEELVKLNLIKIKEITPPKLAFKTLLAKIRGQKLPKLSMEEIMQEVESVRKERYGSGK